MEFQRPVIKLMVLHSPHDNNNNNNNSPRRDSLSGTKSKWRISLSRSSSSSSSSTTISPAKPEIPAEFLCPISGTLMADPIIVSSGHSYERACIIASKTLGFTPNTTPPPDFTTVIPNLALKSAILNWCNRRNFPPPQPLDYAAAEKLIYSLMEKTHRSNRKVSVSEKDLIEAIKDKPTVRLDHAATELDRRRRRNYFNNSSSDESNASSSRALQLTTKPSCFSSSPSSGEEIEIGTLDLSNPVEEQALLIKLKSNRISEIEQALISIRRVTKLDESSRISLCTNNLISSLKSLIVSRHTAVQVNATAVLVNLSLEKSNKVKIVRSGIVPMLIDVLKSSSSSEAQEHSAGAIFSLSIEDENKTAIGVLGGLEPLLHLIRVGSELTRHDSGLALYHLSLVQSNRGKLVKLGAVTVLLNMAKLGQTTNRVLLVLCNMATCPVSRPALLDSGGVEVMVGILRGGEVSESSRESCVAVLYGLSQEEGLRFRGLAMAANAVEELVKVERSGRERAREKARRVLEVMRAKMEDECSPEREEIDWEELLSYSGGGGGGGVMRSRCRIGGDGEGECANWAEF